MSGNLISSIHGQQWQVKALMSILEHLQQVCDRLQQGEFSSEAMVSQGILLPALQAFGWPIFDTQVVIPKYPVAGHLQKC